MTSPNPLDGPFMSSLDLTTYPDEPGYAIPVRDVAFRDVAADVLARLDRAASRKAAA